MLSVQALSFDYLDEPLLANVSLSLNPGQLLHLQGGNGVGKTTLLRLLAGLMRPHSGSIFWEGKPIHDNLPLFQKRLCYVGHKLGLSLDLTIQENCFFDAHWQQNVSHSFQTLLQRFSLEGLADKPCFQLSAGQLKRVSLLRIIMSSARLWLLDEPFTSLDKASQEALNSCLKAHLTNNGLVVMASHQSLPSSLPHESYCL